MRIPSLVFGILLSLVSQVSAADLTDLSDSPYRDSVLSLVSEGIIEGYPDNTFKPDQAINRAEFLKILLETKFKDQVNLHAQKTNNCFSDLPIDNTWYKVYVCTGKANKIIGGFPDGTFRAAQMVNKAEAAKILYNTYFDPIPSKTSPWYLTYFNALKTKGIFLDLFNEDPNSPLTRGQMAFAIDQFNRYPNHQLKASSNTNTTVTKDPEPVNKTVVSPLYVVTSTHPGQEVSGGYISAYSQWQAADFAPHIKNYTNSEAEAQKMSEAVLASVNQKRIEEGKSEMRLDPNLQALSQNFAAHLVINAIYSHSDKLGQDPFQRAKKAGISGFVAESIVWRKRDPLTAIDWWYKSALHWNNIGNHRFVRAGVGIAEEPNGGYIVVLLQGE